MANHNATTNHDWATEISAAWRKSVEAIFETGRLLLRAKDELPRGQFERMVKNELPFSTSTAYRLMAIASDERLTARVQYLPASWGTLYELTQLDDEQFAAGIDNGTINPNMERSDASALRTSRFIDVVVNHTPVKLIAPYYEVAKSKPPPTQIIPVYAGDEEHAAEEEAESNSDDLTAGEQAEIIIHIHCRRGDAEAVRAAILAATTAFEVTMD